MKYSFKIPSLPQSINSMYKINYGHRRIYLSEEGRAFKYEVKMFMPAMKFPKDSKFYLDMEFHGNWLYKNGKNKRADVQNLIKILIDAIFEGIGGDDSYVYGLRATKVQDEKIYTWVEVGTC